MKINLLTQYNELIKTKEISANKYQLDILKKLDKIKATIENNSLRIIKKRIDYNSIFIHGDVGRGKTFIMDLFYRSIATKKIRIHFHNFMDEIHKDLHLIKDKKQKYPIKKIASKYKKKYKIICLDEFHVTDIADAMIIEKIFRRFAEKKIIIITTSNRHPKYIYKGGLQREKYQEFVKYLEKTSYIIELKGDDDYRSQKIQILENNYYYPINQKNIKKYYEIFANLTSNAKTEKITIENKGRNFTIKETSKDIAIIDFQEFCSGSYSSSDYNKIATKFKTIFLKNINIIDNRNIAKRFINMIDIFYEHKNNIIFLAETNYERIYDGNSHKFEFIRTISRIKEMKNKKLQF